MVFACRGFPGAFRFAGNIQFYFNIFQFMLDFVTKP